jgi:hypothetical protein
MTLLRRKGDKPFRGNPREADAQGNGPLVTHRLTISLSRAEKLAKMLASSRAAKTIDVSDLLGGMYLYDWDRLSKYWKDGTQDQTECVLRKICHISPQRWNYWMELYDSQKRAGGRLRSWRDLQRLALARKQKPATEKRLQKSAALRAVYEQAEKLAPFRDSIGDRKIPVLTSECILLCIVRNPNSSGLELSRKLVEVGLNLVKLERAALAPSRPPLR